MESGQQTGVEDVVVRVRGMDANGKAFFQNAYARNLTAETGFLSGIESPLQSGDIIGIQLNEKKARFRILTAKDAGLPNKIQAEVQILNGQQCPWTEFIGKTGGPSPAAASASVAGNKRRFDRHRVPFPIEIRDDRGGGAVMQTSSSDISGRGCYVESLVPLPLGTHVTISLWLGADKIQTPGIVRTSDPGVGMGIEFAGLSSEIQQRLQETLEKQDPAKHSPSLLRHNV